MSSIMNSQMLSNQIDKLTQMKDQLLDKSERTESQIKSVARSVNRANQQYSYQTGSFSKFAVQTENKTHQINLLVQRIIKEAIASHLKQIDIVKNSEGNIKKLKQKSLNQLYTMVKLKGKSELSKVFEDPISFYMDNQPYTSFIPYFSKFIAILLKLAQFVLIDDAVIHIRHLNTVEAIMHENKILLPLFSDQKIYLKLDRLGNKIVYEVNNAFKNKFQMIYMNQRQKETILQMVAKYLEDKKIIVEKNKIQSILENIILQNLKRQ